MAVFGRFCIQFHGWLHSGHVASGLQSIGAESSTFPSWTICSRLYSRKSNAAKRAKKAALRALEKEEKRYVRTAKVLKPFPVDECSDKEPPVDNVWFKSMHPMRQLTFEEAISFHRESMHETVYNDPEAFVNIIAVLHLKTKKQNVTLDKIKGSYMPIHLFPTGLSSRVLALCKANEDIDDALKAGAATAGGMELLKAIEEGNLLVEEYDMVVAHADIMSALAPIRGLLKTKMPRSNLDRAIRGFTGTVGKDMSALVTKVKESRHYALIRDPGDGNVGWINDTIGKLNMPDAHLRENLHACLEGILLQQPRIEDSPFITNLYVKSPSSDEVFLLNRSTILKEEIKLLSNTKRELIQELVSNIATSETNELLQE